MNWSRGAIFVLSTALVWSLGALYEERTREPEHSEAPHRPEAYETDVMRARLAEELLVGQPILADDQVFVRVAARVRPSVVSILALPAEPAPVAGEVLPELPPMSPHERRPGAAWESDGLVAGTGVILDEAGHILTNLHVVRDAGEVFVHTSGGDQYPATILGRDPSTDLAVLRVDGAAQLFPAAFREADLPEVGERVLAIGNAYGLGWSVSLGIVSSLHRSGGRQQGYSDYIQTDAAINPGNSGGPLVDLEGRVIGINCAIVAETGSSAGIGFALPAADARFVADELIARGEVQRGYLGVHGRSLEGLSPARRRELGVLGKRGVYILAVRRESPAAEAGLRQGDVLLEIDGDPIVSLVSLRSRVARTAITSKVALEVVREGERLTLELEVGERPERSKRA